MSFSKNQFVSSKQNPPWFLVIHHHQPSLKQIFRTMMQACLLAFLILGISFFFRTPINSYIRFLAIGFLAFSCFTLYHRLYRRKRVRVIGHVLEYDDGKNILRISLTKAIVSLGVVPPNLLALTFQEQESNLVIGRKAQSTELSNLPIQMAACLELQPADFEELRCAAQRFYPDA